MKNHSNLLNTFKLALVCGATLLPLSDAGARGWNRELERNVDDTTPATLARLKAMCQGEIANGSQNTRWASRVNRLNDLEKTPADNLAKFKMLLGDRRKGKIAQTASVFVKASPEREHKINVAAQIAGLEDFNASMQPRLAQGGGLSAEDLKLIKLTISTSNAQLPQLKKLLELGITEIEGGANLAELISQAEGRASSPHHSNLEQQAEANVAPSVHTPYGIRVDLFIKRAEWDLKNTPESFEAATQALRDMKYYESLGIVGFVDAADLEAQVRAKGGVIQSDEPAVAPAPVSAAEPNDELANLEFALTLAETERERSPIKAQIAKLKPQPAEAVANSNIQTPQPPAPQPVGRNVEENIQFCLAVIQSDSPAREKGIYRAKLAKLEAAKRAGVVIFDREEDLIPFMPASAVIKGVKENAPSVLNVVQDEYISVTGQIAKINAILPTLAGGDRELYNAYLQMHTAALEYGIDVYSNPNELEGRLREHNYRGEIVRPNNNADGLNNSRN